MNPIPVTLEGIFVRLEPLAARHAEVLFPAARTHEIWEFLPFGPFDSLAEMSEWVGRCIEQVEAGQRVWFTIFRRSDGRAVGMSSYMDIHPRDRGLEVGGTWLSPDVWRTPVNTESKYLMLRHAFEELGCLRIQLKTDARNVRSQRAIERLGALKEGVLRKHMIVKNGFVRDSIVYSIVDTDWPAVRQNLERLLQWPEAAADSAARPLVE